METLVVFIETNVRFCVLWFAEVHTEAESKIRAGVTVWGPGEMKLLRLENTPHQH